MQPSGCVCMLLFLRSSAGNAMANAFKGWQKPLLVPLLFAHIYVHYVRNLFYAKNFVK